MIKTEIGRRRRFIIFNGGFEERQEPCQIVKMHNSSGHMVMERSPLSVVHDRSNEDEARRKRKLSQKAEGEKQETTGHQQPRERTRRSQKQEGRTKPEQKRNEQPWKKLQKQVFGRQYSSSDAESKVGWRWTEVPHWESQLVRIIELIATNLAGPVGMEKLP